MGLFDGVLKLDTPDKVRLQQVADATKKIATVLEAFLAKANEPPAPDPEMVPVAEVQERINALVEKMRADRIESADYVARVMAEQFPSGPPVANP